MSYPAAPKVVGHRIIGTCVCLCLGCSEGNPLVEESDKLWSDSYVTRYNDRTSFDMYPYVQRCYSCGMTIVEGKECGAYPNNGSGFWGGPVYTVRMPVSEWGYREKTVFARTAVFLRLLSAGLTATLDNVF